jgi:hypothetical protein
MDRVTGFIGQAISLLFLLSLAPGRTAAAEFSYDDWNVVLARFVNSAGMVAYQELAGDRSNLDIFLDSVKKSGPETTPELFDTHDKKLAYYINAYNVLVFEGVLARGPETESVWRGLISGYNFFVRMKVTLDGTTTNLKSLEDEVVREQFEDPRIHAALNCASLGCPRLPTLAFSSAELNEQLDAAMSEFVNNERHVRVDESRGIVYLSKIFDWYESDFTNHEVRNGNRDPVVLDYINRYRRDGEKLPRVLKVKYLDYDKRINSQNPG